MDGGYGRWLRTVTTDDGYERWLRTVATGGGYGRWLRTVATDGDYGRWLRTVATDGDYGRWLRTVATTVATDGGYGTDMDYHLSFNSLFLLESLAWPYIWGEVWANTTSLLLLLFIAIPVPSQTNKRLFMCVRVIDLASVSTICRLDFGTVPTVWYLLTFILSWTVDFKHKYI